MRQLGPGGPGPAAAEPRRDNDHSVAASQGQCTIRTGTEKWNQPEARIRPGQPQPENDSDVTHGFCSVHVDSECYQNASDLCLASFLMAIAGSCRGPSTWPDTYLNRSIGSESDLLPKALTLLIRHLTNIYWPVYVKTSPATCRPAAGVVHSNRAHFAAHVRSARSGNVGLKDRSVQRT